MRAVSRSLLGESGFADAACTDYKSRSPPLSHRPAPGSALTYQSSSMTSAPHATITAPPLFEDYWCSSIASMNASQEWESYQLGDVGPELYGLAPTAKSICRSLEAEDYSRWATNFSNHPAYTTDPNVFWNHAIPVSWTPTLTPPCCNTFCNFIISSAQLHYWPTPAPIAMKNCTTFIGPDGFT